MNQLMNTEYLLDVAGRCWSINDQDVSLTSLGNAEKRPKIVISDLGSTLVRLETVSCKKQFVAPVVEKLLRDHGDIDGAGKIIISHSQSMADKTTVLYSCIPADRFVQYQQEASSSPDHCMVIPLLSVLNRRLLSRKKHISGVIFQTGRQLYFLTQQHQQPDYCVLIQSASHHESDWRSAISVIAAHLKRDERRFSGVIEWHAWNPDPIDINSDMNEKRLSALFSQETQLNIEMAPQTKLEGPQGCFLTSIPALFSSAKLTDQIFSPISLGLYWMERLLPWASGITAALAIALLMIGFNWSSSVQENRQKIADISRQYDFHAMENMSRDINASNQRVNEVLAANTEFVQLISGIARMPSIPEIIRDIRSTVPASLSVTMIELEQLYPVLKANIQGSTGFNLSTGNHALEVMISKLHHQGYEVEHHQIDMKEHDEAFWLEITNRETPL